VDDGIDRPCGVDLVGQRSRLGAAGEVADHHLRAPQYQIVHERSARRVAGVDHDLVPTVEQGLGGGAP
jgi:hypothetical protein